MQLKEKEIFLKNGKKAVLRSPEEKDAQKLIAFLKQSAAETDFLLCYPEEREMPEAIAEKMLASVLHSPYDMMISCFIGETLVGNAQISIRREIKTAHRATLALAVLQEVWGLGIGSALMREMIAFAEKRCLLQLELSFMEGNTRAEMLYKKMGFTAVSENPNAYRLKDGNMKNEIFMIKSL